MPQLTITVSSQTLQRGIAVFGAQRGWPRDLHNAFYQELAILTAAPVTEQAWRTLVDHLSTWRALRPLAKQTITAAGIVQLGALNHELRALDALPDAGLATITWEQAASLFACAATIKPVTSPVFASKLCHFLRPALYPVVDQAVLGIGSTPYAAYWRACQHA